ncbi:nucleotidyltransferase family protein [Saccharopolyspora cebuensis]|uniref:Nucleotidyltransferase family protein n=1 Tax=Saccharopolyspora cebuensis TaxID=418759 RepID=A0ABV4CLY1_9PSEU
MRVAGVVLAAGAGRRFGGPKALVELGGSLLVERAAQVLADGGCDPVLVVLGAAAAEVRERADLGGAVLLDNPGWESGMGSSLRVALDALAGGGADAALVLPVDMPGVGPEAVRRVAARAVDREVLAAAAQAGRRSHPVLLGRAHWAGARTAAVGDAGARDYLRTREVALVACDDVASGHDIDTPEDLPRG